ncbi:hypothetical protein G3545_13725 [Starkeya sp. ORNL1]|uniref:hypothetical protein n=1 Tax=Starkeya sp. ORNL1 TaxID=2709380 RepID=UPI001463E1E5|nr:hypothetical protein [Starkeya sp. ORNL1]QJP14610.1 hypothetical protein G3545_13725 [Starkeya sp. ORNL1]
MRSTLSTGVVCLALCVFACEARAQIDPGEDAPRAKPEIKGKQQILLNQKFERLQPPMATDKSAQDKAAAAPVPLAEGDGYGSVRYSIGTPQQKQRLKLLIEAMARSLPSRFGNSAGTYVVNITVTDSAGKLLAREPVLSFQWTKQQQLFFIEKTVSEVHKTSWRGTLVDSMLVKAPNQRLKIAVEVSLQEDRSLDFEFIKKAAKAYGASAVATYYPLPTLALPMIESITSLLNDLYARSTKKSLVDEEEVVFMTGATPIRTGITFTDANQTPFTVPVLISIEAQPSVIAPAMKFDSPKFDRMGLTEIFDERRVAVADGRQVRVIELIPASSEQRYRNTRTMLETVQAGKGYSEGDAALRCGDLYGALGAYLSKYDARAMFWSFLQKYGAFLPKDACLGGRKAELEAAGLGE